MKTSTRLPGLIAIALLVAACEAPLQGVGERSAGWINEPEIVTTTLPEVTVPAFIDVVNLQWSNDDIVDESLSDPEAVVSTVFARREGDRFIQASRAEIAATMPGLRFPARVPYGAEWVSSQLVIENSGVLSNDPTAAFGIWSAEPYSRSRSVAQMAILQVARDPDTASEIAQAGESVSCARFSDRSTNVCAIVTLAGRQVWRLSGSSGTTLIWFEDSYRYELYGRTFVPADTLEAMATETIALAGLEPLAS